MAPLTQVVSKILTGEYTFCHLCFNVVGEDAVRAQDEVVVKVNSTTINIEISKLLNSLLGEQCTRLISPYDCICNDCFKTSRDSYEFIHMCRENLENLAGTLNSLDDCLNNVSDDLDSYRNLFISIDTKEFSNKQFYDNQRSILNVKNALARFTSIAKDRNFDKKKPGKSKRERKLYNYSEDLLKMCDVLKENKQTKFKCKVCSGVFNRSFNFKKHYFGRHGGKEFSCTECDKSYGSEVLLKQHVYDSHANIICSECGKCYKNRYSLLYHMRRHSGAEPYECKYCGMKFLWSSRRAEHIRRYHLEPAAECDICHTKFRALGSLYEHRKRHFNPNSRLHVMHETPPVVLEAVVEEVVLETT